MQSLCLNLPHEQTIRDAFKAVLDATGSIPERFGPAHNITGSTLRAWLRDERASMGYVRIVKLIRVLESYGVRFTVEGGFQYEDGGQTAQSDPLRTTPTPNGHNSAGADSKITDRVTMPI